MCRLWWSAYRCDTFQTFMTPEAESTVAKLPGDHRIQATPVRPMGWGSNCCTAASRSMSNIVICPDLYATRQYWSERGSHWTSITAPRPPPSLMLDVCGPHETDTTRNWIRWCRTTNSMTIWGVCKGNS